MKSPSQVQEITELYKHTLQNIESATKSLQDMAQVHHTMVHDESITTTAQNPNNRVFQQCFEARSRSTVC